MASWQTGSNSGMLAFDHSSEPTKRREVSAVAQVIDDDEAMRRAVSKEPSGGQGIAGGSENFVSEFQRIVALCEGAGEESLAYLVGRDEGRMMAGIRTAEEAIMRSKERLDKRAQIAAAEEEVRQAKERLDALKKREHTAAFFDAAARGDTEAAQDSHDAALAG